MLAKDGKIPELNFISPEEAKERMEGNVSQSFESAVGCKKQKA